MRRTHRESSRSLAAAAALAVSVLAACGDGGWAELETVPRDFPIPDPSQPIVSMDLSEDFSLEVAIALEHLAEALREGDRDRALEALTPSFEGPDLRSLETDSGEEDTLGIAQVALRSTSRTDRDGFLESWNAYFGDWDRMEWLRFTVDRGHFQAGRPTWGKISMLVESVGRLGDGTAVSIEGRAEAQVVQRRGDWFLHALSIEGLDLQRRARPIFTEVSAAAGVLVHTPQRTSVAQDWNGVASADLNGDGLWDLFVPSTEANFLYIARPDGGFDEQAERRGVRLPAGGTGVAFFDYDNDGDYDLLVANTDKKPPGRPGPGNPMRFYRNEGSGEDWRFVDVSSEVGLDQLRYSFGVTIFDYDSDGWLDVFVANYGRFNVALPNAWVDATTGQANQLFRNLGGERFEDVAAEAGLASTRWTFLAAAADYDRDGDLDLYEVNDFGPNRLNRNNGDGTFSDATGGEVLEDLGFGMSATWADLDNDGWLDLYISNMQMPVAERILDRLSLSDEDLAQMRKMARGNSLILGRSDGTFELAPARYGALDGRWAWGSLPLDVDLDGRLDIFCTNGYHTGTQPGDFLSHYWRNVIASSIEAEREPSILVRREVYDSQMAKTERAMVWRNEHSYSGNERDKLWLNRGEAGFWDISGVSGADAPIDGRSVIAADFDHDGDTDLFVHAMQLQRHFLYRNDALETPRGFLKIRLRATDSHPEAIGAEVRVHGPYGPHSQVHSCGAQYLSCQPPELLFGIGEQAEARVEVFWPGGSWEDFGPVEADRTVLLVEGSGSPRPVDPPGWQMASDD